MLRQFFMRSLWPRYVLFGLVFTLSLGGVAVLLFNTGLAHWTLKVSTGPSLEGGPAFLVAVTQVFADERPHVLLQRIQTEGMKASAKTLETGGADLAVVRSDIAMPNNGLTIAIFRRDSLVLVVPAHSRLDSLQALAGRKVGLLKGGLAEQDEGLEHLLDKILNFYNINPQRVGRVFLSAEEAGQAVAQKEVAGILALGPSGPGPITKLIAAIAHATKAQPELIGDKQATAIAKTIPGTEPNEIEEGAFGGVSPKPVEALGTLAVTYRLVGKHSLPDYVAGEIARMLYLAKARLMSTSPLAMQIEAPDSEDGSGLPVHPGAAAFFNGEQASLVDSATGIFYLTSIILGLFGSLFAWLLGVWRRQPADAGRNDIERLIAIMREGKTADPETLERLDDELDDILAKSLGQGLEAGQLNRLSIAIRQARSSLDKRRIAMRQSDKAI